MHPLLLPEHTSQARTHPIREMVMIDHPKKMDDGLESPHPHELHVSDKHGKWYGMLHTLPLLLSTMTLTLLFLVLILLVDLSIRLVFNGRI